MDTVIDASDPDRRFPGWPGFVLVAITLILVLGFLPGHPVSLELKTGIFLCMPLFAWLADPKALGSGLVQTLASAHGWAGLVVIAYVAFLEFQVPTTAPGEAAGVLLAAWLGLVWLRTFTSGGLSHAWGLAVSLSVLFVAGAGLAQLYPTPGLEWLRFPGVEQPVSTLGNRNLVAYLMALGLPECLYLASGERVLGMVFGGLGAMGAVAILFLSGSRGAWFALAFASAARLLIPASADGGRPRPKLVLFVLATLCLPVAIVGQAERLEGFFGPQKALTIRTRVFAWRTVWPEVKAGSPLGVGPGGFAREYPRLKEERLRAAPDEEFVELARAARVKRQLHLEWLEIWYEWGSVGFGLAGFYLVLLVLAILTDHSRNPRPRERRRRRIGWVVLIAGLTAAGWSFPFQVAPLAWVILGALARSLGPVRDRPWSLGSILGALALALGCTGLGALRLVSEFDLARGQAAMARGDAEEAAAALARARRFLEDPRAVNAVGRLRAGAGEWAPAGEAFAFAEKLEPTYAHALNLGTVAMRRGQRQQAGQAFQRAWFRQPDQVTGYHLGAWFAAQGRGQDAAGVWGRARKLSGFTGQPGYCLARWLWKQGKLDEAAEVLEEEDRAARAAPLVDADRTATRSRMHMEILRLAIAVHEARKDIPAQAGYEMRFDKEYPGVERGTLGPVGQEEKPF